MLVTVGGFIANPALFLHLRILRDEEIKSVLKTIVALFNSLDLEESVV